MVSVKMLLSRTKSWKRTQSPPLVSSLIGRIYAAACCDRYRLGMGRCGVIQYDDTGINTKPRKQVEAQVFIQVLAGLVLDPHFDPALVH
jgi:hypothetical protein